MCTVAKASTSATVGLGCAISLCLSALFSARYRLESPFAPGEVDAVDMRAEFERLRGVSLSTSLYSPRRRVCLKKRRTWPAKPNLARCCWNMSACSDR